MTLWLSRAFPRIDELLGFVNAEGLSGHQFKIVAAHDSRGAELYHLVYTNEAPSSSPERRMVEADLMPVLGEGEGGDAGEAVEQAEAIIQAHDGEETPT